MKVKLDYPIPLIYPIPITLVGALVEGTPNYTCIGDTGLMGINPPLIFVSSHANHHTNKGIMENLTFSINIPATNLLSKTDYCGSVSGSEVNKSALFSNFFGELKTAPMIEECPVNIELSLVKEFSIEHRQIFVGEVAATHIDRDILVEVDGLKKIPSLPQLDPIIYALDNHYYRIGEQIGTGYTEGKKSISLPQNA